MFLFYFKMERALLPFLHMLVFICVTTQDCKFAGETCVDDKQCCGGCCLSSICVSTTYNCEMIPNPCYEEYCPPNFDCYLFKHNDCPECEPERECRPSKL